MKNNNDLITVITPVYNSEKYIAETIESVQKQTYVNWEMIIVDDCSDDNTLSVVKSIKDNRVKYLKLNKNSGAAVARNIALQRASGRFVAFLDADDKWKPEKLSRQVNFMLNKNIGFSFTSYEIMRNDNNKIVTVPTELNYTQFMKNTIIGTLTVMIDRSIVGNIRIVEVKKDHDSMTWAKILRSGYNAYGLNESLALYRKVEGSISNNKIKAAKTHWNNCRKIERLSLGRCAYFFVFYGWNALKKHYLH